MEDRDSTVRGRELGEALRDAITAAGFNASELARKLGWSSSRMSRLLSGKRGTAEIDVAGLLAVCGVIGPERDRLLDLCREANTPGLLQQHGDRMPKQLRTLVAHEDQAVRIGQFQPLVVPGLLQTEDYARALILETGNVPDGEVEGRVWFPRDRGGFLMLPLGRG